ncbi:MAG TPA: hypothetical protein VE010_07045, partial [Thermoanaerobaculia bacterium]|nr:hypothetical protein [Thermoanaerobaculia bacterium]
MRTPEQKPYFSARLTVRAAVRATDPVRSIVVVSGDPLQRKVLACTTTQCCAPQDRYLGCATF